MPRDTHFLMTRGMFSHLDYPHLDFPKSTRGALLLSTSSGRSTRHSQISHPDDRHITSGRSSYHIWTTDISYPDMFVRIIDWSKQVLHVIITACHGPRSATYRVKGHEWSDGKSLPTIFDSRDASHDLCQQPVGWWWPCHHLVASWQSKISLYH